MSSNALDLLASLYEQLKAISRGSVAYTEGGEAVGDSLPECMMSFEELSKAFKKALETWKWGSLTIFLDSVDQVFHIIPSCFWHTRVSLSHKIRLSSSALPPCHVPLG